MKRLLSILISLLIVLGVGTTTFAAGTQLTPEQQAARTTFMSTYYTQWNILLDLRTQTDAAYAANKDVRHQIATAYKSVVALNKDDIAKAKEIVQKNSNLVAQAKTLNAQRQTAVASWKATKGTDPTTRQTLATQIKSLTDQINTIRETIQTNKTSIAPIKTEIQGYKDAITKLKATLDSLRASEKNQRQTIASEVKAKDALWVTYRTDIQNKDYDAAGTAFQSIIDAKTQILKDVKDNNTILNNILKTINQSKTS